MIKTTPFEMVFIIREKMNDVMVSIYVTTFNHEKYITRALDSILMQETQYSMEVLVGEDCSTDDTRRVLQEWECAHPGKFTIFYRESNMHQTDCPNGMDLKLRCRGKYIICLEGDDFWTDPRKIEKQVTFLEEYPEYYAVSHNCIVVGEDSQPNGEYYPECKDTEYSLLHYASDIMPGQLTTLLSRNYMIDEDFNRYLIRSRCGPGDRNIYFSIIAQGRLYCMQEQMSAYRHITAGGSSYSANYRYSYEKEIVPLWNRVEFARELGKTEVVRYAELQYLLQIRYALRRGFVDAKRARADAKRISGILGFVPLMLKRDICRLLHIRKWRAS